jgi:hypothetical protein
LLTYTPPTAGDEDAKGGKYERLQSQAGEIWRLISTRIGKRLLYLLITIVNSSADSKYNFFRQVAQARQKYHAFHQSVAQAFTEGRKLN